MDIRLLNYFLTVAKEGNITRAGYDVKAALAQKMRDCLVQELHVDPKFVSVSVEDIEPE